MNRPYNLMSKRRLLAARGTSLFRKITTGLLLTFSSLPLSQAEDAPAPAVDPATSLPAAPSWLPPVMPMPGETAPAGDQQRHRCRNGPAERADAQRRPVAVRYHFHPACR
ncbi:hypothetical protein EEAAV_05160 [Rahnella aceris]